MQQYGRPNRTAVFHEQAVDNADRQGEWQEDERRIRMTQVMIEKKHDPADQNGDRPTMSSLDRRD